MSKESRKAWRRRCNAFKRLTVEFQQHKLNDDFIKQAVDWYQHDDVYSSTSCSSILAVPNKKRLMKIPSKIRPNWNTTNTLKAIYSTYGFVKKVPEWISNRYLLGKRLMKSLHSHKFKVTSLSRFKVLRHDMLGRIYIRPILSPVITEMFKAAV